MSDAYTIVITRTANADLSAKQWHVVRAVAGGLCDQASNAAAGFAVGAIGVLQNKPDASGKAASIAIGGLGKIVAGGAITDAVMLTTNSSGRAAAAGSGDIVVARALEAAGADGDIIRCVYMAPWRLSGAV